MSIFDVNSRLDALIKKYEKYDATFKERKEYKDDPFMEEHDDIEMQVEQLMAKSEEVAAEQNRAIAASMNAEIRKAKAAMLTTGVEGLQKKLKKGKNVTKTIVEARQERLKKLIDSIYGIPDGMGGGKRGRGAYSGPGKGGTITLSSAGATGFMNSNPAYYEHSDATKKFDSEWEYAKRQQDAKLDRIEAGVSTLGDMARNIGEELDKQNPIITDIDQQMDRVAASLRTNNQKLKGLVTQMRSSRNVCLDVVLLCLLLGIGAYMYSMFAPK